MKGKKVELLAPAGSFEGLVAAFGAGADAVYLAGSQFGARAYAKNFSDEELLRALDLAHLHGRRVYLTVNTLLKNRELPEVVPYLAPLVEAGLDAVLVQDYGVLRVLRNTFPDLDVHASTQMAVTGPEGLRLLETLGVTRAVPARELSLEEISRMSRATSLEIEVFIHGAMCYSYSGQCLFSSIAGGRSGNRGRCAQPCRLSYEVAGKGLVHPLSMKDLCTLRILPELYEAGVASFKIEGRMKQPAYAAGVTRIYRKYMDLIEKGEPYEVLSEDVDALLGLYSRGGSFEGYGHEPHGPGMIYFRDGGKKGEGREGETLPEPKLKVRGHCRVLEGEKASLVVSADNGLTCGAFEATGPLVGHAQNRPLSEADILSKLSRLGETPFVWEELTVEASESPFLPVRELNELRRAALAGLTEELLGPMRRTLPERPAVALAQGSPAPGKGRREAGKEWGKGRPQVFVSLLDLQGLDAVLSHEEVTGVYLPPYLYRKGKERVLAAGKELYLALPHVVREIPEGAREEILSESRNGMRGLLARSLEGYALARSLGLADSCVLDHSLYTWNEEAISFFGERGALRMTAPMELNEGELLHRGETTQVQTELCVYGYLPLMVSAQCVRGNTSGCDRSFSRAVLSDEGGRSFCSLCICSPWGDFGGGKAGRPFGPCYNLLLNHLPYGLAGEGRRVKELGPASLRFAFTTESPRETERILGRYLKELLSGEDLPLSRSEELTRGHFKRGAR